jgi:uncharacterized repeat protein (TIGR01451 family)
MNAALTDSGVNAQVRLVHAAEVAFDEPGFWSYSTLRQIYDQLRTPGDGVLDEVHSLREAHLADLVSLMPGNIRAAQGYGVAGLPSGPDDPYLEAQGISVIAGHEWYDWGFAHEVGHNLGAGHDWYADGPYPAPRPSYAHAHTDTDAPGEAFVTAVAYTSICDARQSYPCRTIARYSNPDVQYRGRPTGVQPGTDTSCTADNAANPQCDADNRRQMNLVGPALADVRHPLRPAALSVRMARQPRDVTSNTEEIAYTLYLANSGEVPATGVRVVDTLPGEAAFVAGSASDGGQHSGGQLVWSGLTVPGEGSKTLTFRLRPSGLTPGPTALIQTVQVTSNEGATVPPTRFVTVIDGRKLLLPMTVNDWESLPADPGDSDNIADALPLASDQPASGSVSQGDRFDVFRIELRTGQVVDLQLSGTGGDADLYLYGPDATDIALNQPILGSNSSNNDERIVAQVLRDGSFYAAVYAYEGATSYQLRATVTGP